MAITASPTTLVFDKEERSLNMKCFNHRDADAVGVCQSCHRGLCVDCYAEVGNLLACRNRCEEDVARWDFIAQKSVTAYSANYKIYLWTSVFLVVVALPFVVVGSFAMLNEPSSGIVALFIGFVFLLFSLVLFRTARKMR